MSGRVPVTVIAGFLGAGKTTLVNHLLGAVEGRRLAVLVNDFGTINIDERLIAGRDRTVLSLANGCICCSLQGDLVEQVGALLDDAAAGIEELLIETSGVSEPGRIVRALGYPRLRDRIVLEGVVTVLDAARFAGLEGEARRLADEQLAAADLALVNKMDLARDPAPVLEACTAFGVRALPCTVAAVAPELVLGLRRGAGTLPWRPVADRAGEAAADGFETWSYEARVPHRLARLRSVLGSLPESVYRAKGFVYVLERPEAACLAQVVGDRVELSPGVPGASVPGTTLVFIGLKGRTDWPALERRLAACQEGTEAADGSSRPGNPEA